MKISSALVKFFNKACPPSRMVGSRRGSLMLEVLIVVAIIVASVLAAMAVAQKSILLTRQSLHQAQAAFLLEEGAEVVRILRDNNWSNISSRNTGSNYYGLFSAGNWALVEAPNSIGIFTRTVVFSPAYRDGNQNLASSGTLDNETKLVTVTVSWVEGTQNFSKTLQFYITDLFS